MSSPNMVAVVKQVRSLVAEITGMERVFGWGEPVTSTNRLPAALNEWPSAIVFPSEMKGLDQYNITAERHTYAVGIRLFEYPSGQLSDHPDTALPDLLLAKFAANAALGGTCNWDRIESWSYGALEYPTGSDYWYVGWEAELVVSEEYEVTYTEGNAPA